MTKRKPKLEDVARKARVSASTVSRALTRPEMVSDSTRERVLAAVHELQYRPDRNARSLRTRATSVLGIIISDIQNPFYASVVKGAEAVAREAGYSIVICNSDEDPDTEEQALIHLAEMHVAGLIVSPVAGDTEAIRWFSDQRIPIVEIDRTSGLSTSDQILVDNERGAQLAAEYLHRLGHTRVATIAGPQILTPGKTRLEGFLDFFRAKGVPLPDEYIYYGDFRYDSGYQGAKQLLALSAPPRAVFVASNEMLAGALAALADSNCAVPDDISVLAFADVRWAEFTRPRLTTVVQPASEIGAMGAEAVLSRIGASRPRRIKVVEPRLIVRDSCAPPSGSCAPVEETR